MEDLKVFNVESTRVKLRMRHFSGIVYRNKKIEKVSKPVYNTQVDIIEYEAA